MKKVFACILLAQIFCMQAYSQERARGAVPEAIVDISKTTYALVAGISGYANIPQLEYADKDAQLFKNYLIDQRICQPENISLLLNEAATTAGFFKELKNIIYKAKSGDRVFIYFAGHGDVEAEIETGFLLPYNCEANNYSATSIDLSSLEKYVNALVNRSVKVVLVMDACRSGSLAGGLNGVKLTMGSFLNGFQKTVKLLSCQPNQLSKEQPFKEGGHGVFTYHLVNGLNGEADKNKDGQVSVREISLYLDEKVSEQTNDSQIPKVEGDLQSSLVSYIKKDPTKPDERDKLKAMKLPKRKVKDDPIYQEFMRYIDYQLIYSPDGPSAYSFYEEVLKGGGPAELLAEMSNSLAEALEALPQQYINRYLKGILDYNPYQERANLQTAYIQLEKLLEITSPEDFRYNEIKAKQLFFHGLLLQKTQPDTAYRSVIGELKLADSLLPNKAWILHNLANLYKKIREYGSADSCLDIAMKLSPAWCLPWNTRGNLYLDQKKYTESQLAYNKALTLDSNFAYAWNNLGILYKRTQNNEKALECFHRSLQKNPASSETNNNLGALYLELGKDSVAEQYFKQGILLDSLNAHPFYMLSFLYLDRKENAKAMAYIEQTVRLNNLQPAYWYDYAKVYVICQVPDKAIEGLKKALQLGFKGFNAKDPIWEPLKGNKDFKALVPNK